MNKRHLLLHLAIGLILTTQVHAQEFQSPAIIMNPAIIEMINNSNPSTTPPDRTNPTDDSTDLVGQTDTPTDDSTTTTTNNNNPVSTVDNQTPDSSEPENPITTTKTPEISGPGPERPVYTITPVTPTETVTPTRPTRPTTPQPPEETPPTEEPVENCPLFNPLDQNPVKCPDGKPIIPTLPIMIVLGPLGGLLLFFFIFKLLQNSHLKTETRLEQKRQNNLNQQRSSEQQHQTYQDYLDFVSTSLTKPEFDQNEFLKQQAQLELFGSEKMLKLHQQVGEAFQANNHQEIKKLLPTLITQIRLEE